MLFATLKNKFVRTICLRYCQESKCLKYFSGTTSIHSELECETLKERELVYSASFQCVEGIGVGSLLSSKLGLQIHLLKVI